MNRCALCVVRFASRVKPAVSRDRILLETLGSQFATRDTQHMTHNLRRITHTTHNAPRITHN
jgi:hypothetical protein